MRKDSTRPRAPTAAARPEALRVAPLIDIGINLAHDSYDPDRDAVLARAEAAGVLQLVITGSSGPSTRQAIELAQAHPGRLFATAGVHPHHASDLTPELLAELEALAQRPEVVAIGECGLDYFRNFSPQKAQRSAFHRQLELAARVGNPLDFHHRGELSPAKRSGQRQRGADQLPAKRAEPVASRSDVGGREAASGG